MKVAIFEGRAVYAFVIKGFNLRGPTLSLFQTYNNIWISLVRTASLGHPVGYAPQAVDVYGRTGGFCLFW